MAEYYPLLVRAVAALPDATPETRRNVYERARKALIGQLRKIDPPVPEADIERESRALDDAVARLEDELKAAAPAPKPAAAAAPPPPSFPPRMPAAPPRVPATAAPSNAAKPFEAPPRMGPPLGRPADSQAPSAPPPRPPVPSREASLSALAAAPDKAQPRPQGPVAPLVAPAQREPGRGLHQPPVRAPESKAVPPRPAAAGDMQSIAGSQSAPQDWASFPATEPAPAAAKPDWRGFGRPRHDSAAKVEGAPVSTDAASLAADTAKFAQGRGEAVRPAAPQPKAPRRGFSRHWIVGSIVALVVVVIAGMAFKLRDNPEDLIRHPAAPPAEAPQSSGKIVDRVGGGAAGQPDTRPATAPAATQAPQAANDNAQQNNGVIPVAQRAALLVDAPDLPQKVKTYVGTVVWRRENVNHGQDQTLSVAVRADIDLPEAKLKATVIFQKNFDATLPASHTIEVRFMPADGSPIPGVMQIDVPQMRKEDTPAGDPLAGVPAPITQNYFLIGLTQGDAAVARNIDLIKSRQWFDIPLQLSDNRIAKITFEKGDPGERAIADALAAWQ